MRKRQFAVLIFYFTGQLCGRHQRPSAEVFTLMRPHRSCLCDAVGHLVEGALRFSSGIIESGVGGAFNRPARNVPVRRNFTGDSV